MERSGLLDPINEVHLLSLHLVFPQEIKKSLDEFTRQWNYHGLSKEGGSSPLQLWTEGILRSANGRNSPLDGILSEEELIWYGVDEEDAISVLEEDQEVIVPSSNIPLRGDQLDYLHSLVPTNLTRSERISKYVEHHTQFFLQTKKPSASVSYHVTNSSASVTQTSSSVKQSTLLEKQPQVFSFNTVPDTCHAVIKFCNTVVNVCHAAIKSCNTIFVTCHAVF